tara:strand:+ start:19239 stop:19577 length:339 start_codon:yes stop_codon:yes gene_type:complete
MGIRLQNDGPHSKRVVRFTPPTNAGEVVHATIPDNGEVKMTVDCTATCYRFGYRVVGDANEDWTWIAEVDTQVLTRNPEIGQPFTGMMLGLYAFGELQPVLAPAHFAFAAFR